MNTTAWANPQAPVMNHINSWNLNALIGMAALAIAWPLTLFVITRRWRKLRRRP